MNSRIFPWKTLAIATAVLVVLFVGGFLISGSQPVQSRQTAPVYKAPVTSPAIAVVTTVSQPANTIAPPAVVAKPRPRAHKITAKPVDTGTATSVANTIEEEQTPLDEMVVMGMAATGNKAAAENGSSSQANPKNGWSSFETYLRESAVSPDGKTGTVKLSFTVNNDGSCGNFKVENSLTKAADQKAIELIKNGPLWIGNPEGEPKETTVSVVFH